MKKNTPTLITVMLTVFYLCSCGRDGYDEYSPDEIHVIDVSESKDGNEYIVRLDVVTDTMYSPTEPDLTYNGEKPIIRIKKVHYKDEEAIAYSKITVNIKSQKLPFVLRIENSHGGQDITIQKLGSQGRK